MKRYGLFIVVLLLCLFPGSLMAQETLTNESVIKLARAGLHEDLIVNIVDSQPGKYLLGSDDVLQLKKEGVTDRIVTAMLRKFAGGTVTASAPAGLPAEIGIYIKRGEEWSELLPEVVNWKTGGVLKSVASLGVVRQDINGHIEGGKSRHRASNPVSLLVIAPEGTAITEYQLLKLNQHSNDREFRAVTGGVFHAKGGAAPDMVAFQSRKIAPRTFVIDLTGIANGEYGLLPPGLLMSASSASPLGKIYSFGFD